MKSIVAILVLVAVASAATNYAQLWGKFKAQYARKYASNGEEGRRFAIFKSNVDKAAEYSRRDPKARYGVTQFMDLSRDEFISQYAGLNESAYTKHIRSLPVFNAPKAEKLGADWKAKGYVTPVKDQGSCGSCWAFSATQAAEGCAALKAKKAVKLSAAQMADCCKADGSDGCNGGWQDACLEWAMGVDLATEDGYPKYDAMDHNCRKVTKVGLKKNTCEYYQISHVDEDGPEDDMVEALTHNVVAIAVEADVLQFYSDGVISGDMCTTFSGVNHAVLLVSDEATDEAGDDTYYLIKNSWGSTWGESGYYRAAKGVNCLNMANVCAVAY